MRRPRSSLPQSIALASVLVIHVVRYNIKFNHLRSNELHLVSGNQVAKKVKSKNKQAESKNNKNCVFSFSKKLCVPPGDPILSATPNNLQATTESKCKDLQSQAEAKLKQVLDA